MSSKILVDLPSADTHCRNVMQNLHRLKSNDKLCDMALGAGGEKFFAHKCVILAACPILETFIDETQTEFPYVVCSEVSAKGLSIWIDYIYTGLTPKSVDDQKEFMKVCDTFFMFGKDPELEVEKSPVKAAGTPMEGITHNHEISEESLDTLLERTSQEVTKRESPQKSINTLKQNTTLSRKRGRPKKQPPNPPVVQDNVPIEEPSIEVLVEQTSEVIQEEVTVEAMDNSEPEISDSDHDEPIKEKRKRKAPVLTKKKKKDKDNDTERKYAKFPNDPPFICPKESCNVETETRQELTKHYRVHSKKKQFVCKECNKEFFFYHEMKAHEMSHSGIIIPDEEPFSCPWDGCSFNGNNHNNTWKHYRDFHLKRLHGCDVCQKCFLSSKELKSHLMSHFEGETFDCDHCDMKFPSKAKLYYHKKSILTPKTKNPVTVICEICGITYKHNVALVKHLLEKHEILVDANYSYNPDDESKKAVKALRMQRLANIPQEPPFICPHSNCKKVTETRVQLLKHYRSHNERQYACQFCDGKYRNQKDLRVHERLHTGERPFACELCDKRFTQKCTLDNHMVTHQPMAKKEVCDICGLEYNYKKTLSFHRRYKHGIYSLKVKTTKPTHECEKCGKSYISFGRYEQHLTTCVAPVDLVCKKCKKKFPKPQLLHKHMDNCKGKRAKCEACDLQFDCQDEFREHMREVHIPEQRMKRARKAARRQGKTVTVMLEYSKTANEAMRSGGALELSRSLVESENDHSTEVEGENTDISALDSLPDRNEYLKGDESIDVGNDDVVEPSTEEFQEFLHGL